MRSSNFKYVISPIVSSLEGMGLILERKLVLSPMTGEIVIMDAGKSKRGDMTLFISRFLSLLISNQTTTKNDGLELRRSLFFQFGDMLLIERFAGLNNK